jgi:hypothetical protein
LDLATYIAPGVLGEDAIADHGHPGPGRARSDAMATGRGDRLLARSRVGHDPCLLAFAQ